MRFLSRWQFTVPRQEVWRVFEDLVDAPDPFLWWPGLRVLDRDQDELNVEARSLLGYRLGFRLHGLWTRPPERIGLSCDGDLRGRAVAKLSGHGPSASTALIEWRVALNRPWMRATLPVLRPVFVGAHHHMMRRGRRGLQAHLRR